MLTVEDLLLIEFASSEKQFIYNEGVNKGHSLSYSKVNRCLFISAEAKQLYHNICDYAYGDKRDCYPSHQSLMLELGWGNTKLKDAIKELKDVDLIKVKTIPGKSSIYSIQEIHLVPVLYHSEIIYALINYAREHSIYDIKSFQKKLNEYKKSNLYKEVVESRNPMTFNDEIFNFFFNESTEVDEPVNVNEPKDEPKEDDVKEEVEVPNVKPNKPKARRGINIVPTELNELDKTNEHEPKKPNKKPNGLIQKGLNSFEEDSSKADLSEPREKWGFFHLFKYFNHKYEEKYGNLPMSTVVDGRNLKRIIKRKLPLRVITDIDNYFALDAFTGHSMQGFCSQWVQSSLDTYLNSGKLPTYKKNTSTPTPDIEKNAELQEWEKGLDSIFDK